MQVLLSPFPCLLSRRHHASQGDPFIGAATIHSRSAACRRLGAERAGACRMDLGKVAAARSARLDRPSWAALFIKAYARVAVAIPELRRAYVKFPWPHLVEYPVSVASVAVERDYCGEPAVFIGRVKKPDALGLDKLTALLRHWKEVPIEECKDFRRALRLSRYPWPLRSWAWWLGLNIARQRGNYFGTFALSVYSQLGAESLHPLSPITTTLNYGVIGPDQKVDVRITYDHRVMDGSTVARALAQLESELTGAILDELRLPESGVARAA